MGLKQQQAGAIAEQQASRFLQQQGLTELAKNYRCRSGELDLVMQDRETLVFVEVRQRRNTRFGDALESIDIRKQRRVRKAAEYYLLHHTWHGPCRFDTIGIDATGKLHWIQSAFE
ncbi:MAG: YraN family protein [Pseudomonadota bacterium]